MRENCTYSLSGGRWPACKRATFDPTPQNRPNQEASAWAEGGEGRLRVKENASPAHTHPAQKGVRGSQGLAGVRQAARQRKQERFTTLLHHLTEALLRDSF